MKKLKDLTKYIEAVEEHAKAVGMHRADCIAVMVWGMETCLQLNIGKVLAELSQRQIADAELIEGLKVLDYSLSKIVSTLSVAGWEDARIVRALKGRYSYEMIVQVCLAVHWPLDRIAKAANGGFGKSVENFQRRKTVVLTNAQRIFGAI